MTRLRKASHSSGASFALHTPGPLGRPPSQRHQVLRCCGASNAGTSDFAVGGEACNTTNQTTHLRDDAFPWGWAEK